MTAPLLVKLIKNNSQLPEIFCKGENPQIVHNQLLQEPLLLGQPTGYMRGRKPQCFLPHRMESIPLCMGAETSTGRQMRKRKGEVLKFINFAFLYFLWGQTTVLNHFFKAEPKELSSSGSLHNWCVIVMNKTVVLSLLHFNFSLKLISFSSYLQSLRFLMQWI